MKKKMYFFLMKLKFLEKKVNYIVSKHAQKEMNRREIILETVSRIMENPDQIVEEYGGKKAYQSIIDYGFDSKYLVRVIVNDSVIPMVVVTVYRTSKINKYWRE